MDWLGLTEVKEACRKLHTVDGRKPCAVLTRNGETEFLLLFEPWTAYEAYGVLPVDGGFLPAYAYGDPNLPRFQGMK